MVAKLEGQSRPLRLAVGTGTSNKEFLEAMYLCLSVWRPIVAVVVYCLFIAVCCCIVLMITCQ